MIARSGHSRRDALKSANLDFDARVPIPFSVFPSSYRSDAVSETTQTRVEGEVQLDRTSHVEREDTQAPLPDPRVFGKEEVDVHTEHHYPAPTAAPPAPAYQPAQPSYQPAYPQPYTAEVDVSRDRYNYQPSARYDQPPQAYDQPVVESQLDITERDYRRRTSPTYDVNVSYDRRYQQPVDKSQPQASVADFSYDRAYPQQPTSSYRGESFTRPQVDVAQTSRYAPTETKVTKTTTVRDTAPTRKMGYYDDEGQYHSFRRGVQRAADHLMHPFHDRHDHEEVINHQGPPAPAPRENVRIIEPRNRGTPGETVAIPCHFIRIGDILILQGRPCQVIRISVSSQTGQHRYLGVDLFTRQLQEESSFVSNPSPSVVVQTMLGPVFKTYRILDINNDSTLTAMTETGDVKQGLPVITQGSLFGRISEAFADGRGSVRALVINDGGRELVVDYKVIHGSRL